MIRPFHRRVGLAPPQNHRQGAKRRRNDRDQAGFQVGYETRSAELGKRGKSVGKQVQHKLTFGGRMAEIGLCCYARSRNDTVTREIYL